MTNIDLSFLGAALLHDSSPEVRAKALSMFQELQSNPEGWRIVIPAIEDETFFTGNDTTQFSILVLIQNHVKQHLPNSSAENRQQFRNFIIAFFRFIAKHIESANKVVKMKFSAVVASTFVVEYPNSWSGFFQDLQVIPTNGGQSGVELYLNILKEINSEISDREIARSDSEMTRNTLIKDTMRDNCVPDLAKFWREVLLSGEMAIDKGSLIGQTADIINLCLDVMAGYIQWIDIQEVANDQVVSLLLKFCFQTATRKSAVETIDAVCCKGMLPDSKLRVIASFYQILSENKVLNFNKYDADDEEDIDFLITLSSFVNSTLIQFVEIFKDYARKDFSISNAALTALESKIEFLVQLIGYEDDDVSKAVLPASRELISIYRQVAITPERKSTSRQILCCLIKKYKFEKDYDFDSGQEEENEFVVYRQELKSLFDNLAKLDNLLVTEFVRDLFVSVVPNWSEHCFDQVELALSLLYLLGECLPHVSGNIFASETPCTTIVCQLLHAMLQSNVSQFEHPSILLMYHEVVVRFDKFFAFNPQHIPSVLESFTSTSGILSKHATVRGRCAYLFSRFIKLLKNQMVPHKDLLLGKIENIIQVVFTLDNNGQGDAKCHINSEDSQYLFEAVGVLIQMSGPERTSEMMGNVLVPINQHISLCVDQLVSVDPQIVQSANPKYKDQLQLVANKFSDFVSFASRLSKAFSSSQATEASGCTACLVGTLEIILKALEVKHLPPDTMCTVHTAVRQYLHRMVICLSSELVLHYIRHAIQRLLVNQSERANVSGLTSSVATSGLIEFIPLVNQVVARYKKQSIEMLGSIFVPVLEVFSRVALSANEESAGAQMLNGNSQSEDKEFKSQLKRSFFTFINTILANEAFPVIACQGHQVVWMVLMAVADGALNFPDPVTQKLCFSILRKFVEVANGESGGENEIREFTLSHVIPACFRVCCSPGFNSKDAQSNMALMEAGAALKFSYDKYGDTVTQFLSSDYLPAQNIQPDRINELCIAIKALDSKRFKDFYKEWILKILNC